MPLPDDINSLNDAIAAHSKNVDSLAASATKLQEEWKKFLRSRPDVKPESPTVDDLEKLTGHLGKGRPKIAETQPSAQGIISQS